MTNNKDMQKIGSKYWNAALFFYVVWIGFNPSPSFAGERDSEPQIELLAYTDHPGQRINVLRHSLGPCLITIAYPEKGWNGKLLLYNHGMRFDHRPLKSDLPLRQSHYKTWLLEGWMVATSSFRRQGMIVRDAVEDTGDLYEYIVSQFGKPERTLLIGESMGATISVLMVENEPQKYHGALAISMGFSKDSDYPIARTHRPEVPILLICNSNESGRVLDYLHKARGAPVEPAFWWLDRIGM